MGFDVDGVHGRSQNFVQLPQVDALGLPLGGGNSAGDVEPEVPLGHVRILPQQLKSFVHLKIWTK